LRVSAYVISTVVVNVETDEGEISISRVISVAVEYCRGTCSDGNIIYTYRSALRMTHTKRTIDILGSRVGDVDSVWPQVPVGDAMQ